jgi:putative hydrolases of HD superfamily
MSETINPLPEDLAFIAYLDRLKTVIRANGLFDGSRDENTAEHSWHLAISAMVLSEYANEKVDVDHVIQMLLVHDLVEIEAGDVPIYAADTLIAQEAVEAEAAVMIFDQKAGVHGECLRGLWDEFQARVSPDSKFARAIDRFLPFFSNFYNRGYSWLPYEVSVDQMQNSIALIRDGSTRLADIAETMVEIAVRDGFLGK